MVTSHWLRIILLELQDDSHGKSNYYIDLKHTVQSHMKYVITQKINTSTKTWRSLVLMNSLLVTNLTLHVIYIFIFPLDFSIWVSLCNYYKTAM